ACLGCVLRNTSGGQKDGQDLNALELCLLTTADTDAQIVEVLFQARLSEIDAGVALMAPPDLGEELTFREEPHRLTGGIVSNGGSLIESSHRSQYGGICELELSALARANEHAALMLALPYNFAVRNLVRPGEASG